MKDGSYDTYNSGLMVSFEMLLIHKLDDLYSHKKQIHLWRLQLTICGDLTCAIGISNMEERESFLS